MSHLLSRTVKKTIKALIYTLVGGFIALIVVFVWYLESRPDLKVWHTADLDAEFTANMPTQSFTDYMALEERLFAQLDERVYAQIQPEDRNPVNRYHRGSLSDPERWSRDWNRSFELSVDAPKAGVLLLHGLSDSPYSLRNLGQRLHEAGAQVVGLRVPGHGTAPSGLVEVSWQDMAAAVTLAVRHLRDQIGKQPLYIVGYSNGGALAVHYALSALEDPTLPTVDRIVLISPAIGVAPVAVLAVWQARLGHLLGLEKLAWNAILPEYDPFKYGSFAVNAGDLIYRLTEEIQSRIEALRASDDLSRFPPLLAFQSAVDATVSAPALVSGLFERLPAGGHELVLFDINRMADIESILRKDPGDDFDPLFNNPSLPFAISLISNENHESPHVIVRHKKPETPRITQKDTGLTWPNDIYSLAHVALPFPMSDPLYGDDGVDDSPGIRIGDLAMRGERGVLWIPAGDMLRLRWNPFYPYLERRVLEFFQLAPPSGSGFPRGEGG